MSNESYHMIYCSCSFNARMDLIRSTPLLSCFFGPALANATEEVRLPRELARLGCFETQDGVPAQLIKDTVYLQRENFWIFIFLDRNKLYSKILQTKKGFLKKSEYFPRNWDVSDFHRKLNFTLIDSILLPM